MDVLGEALTLFTRFATIGGGVWAVWGIIELAGGLREQNGQAKQQGIWQIIGGAMILAGATLFNNIVS